MKVAVGISGGVDSAVAALLLKEQGHEIAGVTMTLGRPDEAKSVAEAGAVADRLGIPLHVFDFAADWKRLVLDYITDSYFRGQTPNPCVKCNEFVKFGMLPRAAFELGCDRFATGHYARKVGGRVARAVDRAKDQSYFLYRVHPEVLDRTLFPLGELRKSEIRELARSFGFEAADREDSQDFCGGDIPSLVEASERRADIPRGRTVDLAGRVLGRHDGYWKYTIGQRKGLGIGGGGIPYYVIALRPETNEVVVGFREEALSYDLELRDPVGRIDKSLPVKVRSAGEPKLLRDGILGVAPGQSAVFYDGDIIVGGGIISVKSSKPETTKENP